MAEQFANNAATTLNGAIIAGATSLVVTSAAQFPGSGDFRILIGSELMLVTAVAGTTFTITRGVESTTDAGHANGDAVTHVITAASLIAAVTDYDRVKHLQTVFNSTAVRETTTTSIPLDDTIPQSGEGKEILTCSITPQDPASDLYITFNGWITTSGVSWIIVALFQDSGANALQAIAVYNDTNGGGRSVPLVWKVAAGSITPTTFKIRMGPNAGATLNLNGQANGAVRYFGGVSSATLKIEEILP